MCVKRTDGRACSFFIARDESRKHFRKSGSSLVFLISVLVVIVVCLEREVVVTAAAAAAAALETRLNKPKSRWGPRQEFVHPPFLCVGVCVAAEREQQQQLERHKGQSIKSKEVHALEVLEGSRGIYDFLFLLNRKSFRLLLVKEWARGNWGGARAAPGASRRDDTK